MFKTHSIAGRVVVGKTAGFILGAVAFFGLPLLGAETTTMFNLGVWLLSILMGTMIGFAGVFATHPVLNFRTPFYVRGAIVGASFFLLLPLLAMGDMQNLMQLNFVEAIGLSSVWWVVVEGAVWGVLIGLLATMLGGEGDLPVK